MDIEELTDHQHEILANIALEFCKSCLGWERAFISKIANGSERFIDRGQFSKVGERAILTYESLDAVLSAVREWCEQHSYGWSLGSGDETQRLTAIIYTEYDEIERPWVMMHGELDEHPTYNLMSACIAASKAQSDE